MHNPLQGLLTVEQAADRLAVKPGTVYRYLNSGLIRKTKLGRAVFIAEREIDRYQEERRPVGRPATEVPHD